ncbi:hypothetical protein RFI_33198, partial [Reticulomyxa filosa]
MLSTTKSGVEMIKAFFKDEKLWRALKTKDNVEAQIQAAQQIASQAAQLRNNIATSSSPEDWKDFLEHLGKMLIEEHVHSHQAHEIIGGILVMKELVGVDLGSHDQKIYRFTNYLRTILETSETHKSKQVISLAVQTFGDCIANSSETQARNIIEQEIPRALDCRLSSMPTK